MDFKIQLISLCYHYSVFAETMSRIPGSHGGLHGCLNFQHIWRFEMGLMVSMFPVLCSES